MKYHKLAYFNF